MRHYWEEAPKTAETPRLEFLYYPEAQRLMIRLKPWENAERKLAGRSITVNLQHLRLQPVEKRREIADLLNDIVMALE